MTQTAIHHRRPMRRLSLLLLLMANACASPPNQAAEVRPDSVLPFESIMEELATAWNQGDAARAAACFTADAVYNEPPDKQLFEGRDALYEFFGGDSGRAGEMEMRWHHLAFDERTGIGFGEFSFTYGTTAHGVAVVRLRDGKIANWREYWYESTLVWDEFVRANPF